MTLFERALTEHVGGNGDVLHDAGQVAEPQVDEVAPFALHQREHLA